MKTLIASLLVLSLMSCQSPREEVAVEMDLMKIPKSGSSEMIAQTDPELAAQKLVKRGFVEFEVSDIAETKEHINKAVSSALGYVSIDSEDKENDRLSCKMTVRIPASKFDSFLNDATKGVSEFDNKRITVEDVTEEFTDIQARLKTKKEIEARYLALLSKSNSVKDILGVETELGTIRTDIESIEGRMKYLSSQVRFSTLDITFYKTTLQTTGVGGKIKLAFFQGWTNLFDTTLVAINVWPFILLIIGAIWAFRKVLKRRIPVATS